MPASVTISHRQRALCDRRGDRDGHGADRATLVVGGHRDPAQRITGRVDVLDTAHRGVHQVEDVRADVEQRTALDPPRRGERTAGKRRSRDEAAHATASRRGLSCLQERLADHGEPVAQHQHGLDTGLVDGRNDPLGLLEGEPERLLEDEVLARPCRGGSQLCLDVRRDGEGDGVAASQQVLEARRRDGAVVGGQRLGRLVPPGPDRLERRTRVCGEHRRVEHPGPRSRSDQPHSHAHLTRQARPLPL